MRGEYVYEANYTTGLRIFHAANIASIREVGFFDTYPADNGPSFDGAWGVYTGLPSGVILVSVQDSGLFVLMADCNGNDQDDGEELRSGAGKDCNLNGILDACDLTEGTAEDCNGTGVLDECDTRASEDFAASSGELSPIGYDDPQSFTLESPPFAALDVTLSFAALSRRLMQPTDVFGRLLRIGGFRSRRRQRPGGFRCLAAIDNGILTPT